jgi:hypothetical protein
MRLLIRRYLFLLAILLLNVSAAWAGTWDAFGPKSYQRQKGESKPVRSNFSILNPNTQFTLRVTGNQHAHPTIVLNGRTVLDEDDFRQPGEDRNGDRDGKDRGDKSNDDKRDQDDDRNDKTITVEKAVTLKLANTIAVEVEGRPGSAITAAIIGVDNDPPVISAVASPAPNAAGWNNQNVVVTFTCSDKTSGVASCPAPVNVSAEGANQVISGTATDLAGNTASASITINLDKTAPTIAASPAPPANNFGWNNSAVTVGFNCADALSGIAFCTAPVTLSSEGASQVVNGQATDKAGNSAVASATVSIDKTPPTITSTATPSANAAGWNNTNVAVAFTCADSLSGVASCPTVANVTTEGANQSITGAATDKAGNTASTARSLNIDKTPPSITASLSPAANTFGWNNTSVTVNFACTDALSGVASCASPAAFTKEGAGQTASGNSTDVAGNSATASAAVNIDETPPSITAAIAPAPNAAGWNNTNVIVSFTCADSGSGIANCPLQQAVISEGANQNISGTATDKAGNSANASVTVNIDRTPPSITAVVSPSPNLAGWNNTDVTVTFTCSDAGSGVATCPGPVQVTTEGANQVITGTATDIAGNTTTTSVTLKIDKTPPVITANVSPQPNANGWNTSLVTVTFQCSDSGSGIVSCPGPQTVSTEGANQLVSGTATDAAGNTSSASATISLETSSPRITVTGAPPANGAGWNNTDVTVSFLCTPAVAPITSCPGQQVVTTEGANQSFPGTVTDAAGNTATTSISLNIDKTPPVISSTVLPAPAANGIINATSATVSFTCSDSLSGVLSCPSPVTVTTTGLQTISGTATDNAGNTASTSVQFNLQPFPPLKITASTSPAANAAGWNNSPVTVTFICTGGAPPVSCPAARTVSTDGANQVISGTATDAIGDSATATATVNLDQTPPLISITSPADGSISPSASVAINGLASDGLSGVAAVSCNGTPATFSSGSFNCTLQITKGSLSVSVQATDVAGNTASASLSVNLQGPKLTITSPAPLDLFSNSSITVTGTVDDPNATVVVNGTQATSNGATFMASGVILREGNNLVTATGTNAGGAAGTASVNVVLDTTPPTVRIDSPSDGAILTTPQIYVTGLVNDVVTGTVNNAQASVIVNGVKADVGNRSFMADGVLLVPGQNVITAVARDRAGNISQSQITVTLQDAASQQRILMVSGNGQSAPISSTLPQPLVVEVVNAVGQPLPNVPVTFSVNKSDGQLSAVPQQGRQLAVQTDANGQASVTFQLGTRVGNGNNQVIVTAPGFVGEVMFCASSTVGPPSQIHEIIGSSQSAAQSGVIGQPLPEPFVAGVFDESGNPVAGVPVVFTVALGGGTLEGKTTVTKTTDTNGLAAVVLALAQEEGVGNNEVTATFSGLSGPPAIFTASGLTPKNPASTTVTGLVLDNANQPVPNATASIKDTNLNSLTDSNGQFTISNVPIGSIVLFIDGSTSTRTETFPFLEFPMVTVAGQNNHLSGPIFLPPLDTDNSKIVGGDEDVVLTMKGVPGLAYTVFAHSATFPDGSKVGRMTLSQVHSDKVPMALPNGTSPSVVGTLQPARVKFNPPVRVQVPNANAVLPGQVAEVFSFDHDLEQFVSSGTARASEDGSVIVSDPGFGLRVAGWHAVPPPPPPPKCVNGCPDGECFIGTCVGGHCQNVPINDGKQCGDLQCSDSSCQNTKCVAHSIQPNSLNCDDGKKCTDRDQCNLQGECHGIPKPDHIPVETAYSMAFDSTNGFEGIGDMLRIIFGNDNLPAAKLTFSVKEKKTGKCCEEQDGNFLDEVEDGLQGSVSADLGKFPISPFPEISAVVNRIAKALHSEVGLNGKVSISANGSIQETTKPCEKQVEGEASGSIGLKIGIELELKAPANIVSFSAGGSSGISGSLAGNSSEVGTKVFIQAGLDAGTLSAEIVLANGLFHVEKSAQLWGPQQAKLICLLHPKGTPWTNITHCGN